MNTSLATPKVAKNAAWQIDGSHSNVGFSVRHLMISTVRGRFDKVTGTAKGIGATNSSPELEVTIDASSIDTGVAQRDEHLRSADFFDVAKFPALKFRATRIEGAPTGRFKLVGDLTIRDVTREVVLDVENLGTTPDPWGNLRVGFSATGSLNRKDFGLTWNQVVEAGGVMVGDEVKLTVDVALTSPAE